MKKLLIVESPAKIKTIQKFLGSEFKIMSTLGHIMDLPSKTIGVSMDEKGIDLQYVPIEGKEKVIAEICKAASGCEAIYLAPDPDREGEIIAWLIGEQIAKVIKNKNKMHRITFNEITKPAILQALENTSDVNMHRVNAQQARRVLDRWVGYEVSPVLWKKVAPGLSAGRVQSVALRLICDREQAIRDFKPEEYWSITGTFKHARASFEAALTHIGKKKAEITSKAQADEIVAGIQKADYIIDSITDKNRLKNPMPPFMTSTLQQAAFNRLGFSVKKTMQVAQNLYEGIELNEAGTPVALITYMRTDSKRLSDTAIKQARDYIGKHFDKEYLPSKPNIYEGGKGNVQDAHEAIRPIDVNITPEFVHRYAPKDAAKLYELIWKCFVACQMKPAEYAQRQVVLTGDEYVFKVTGSTLIFDGFLAVYHADDEEEDQKVVLPKTLKEKEAADLEKVDPKQHFTQPPAKYSEASLVKALEKEGIGRPSTYATILSTIEKRQYTTVDKKKRFTPTELGMTVTKILVENLPKIMDVSFTAAMEQDLDKIEQGDLERDKLLRDFYATFQEDLKKFIGKEGGRQAEPTDIDCPECGAHKLAIRFGKGGEFLGCLGFPECSFTTNFERDEKGVIKMIKPEKPTLLDELCPKCGKQLRKVIGKYGEFTACSGYPECNYIKREVAAIPCPKCGGEIIERKWRGGKFWGCSNYPKCKFAVFGEIEVSPCPKCDLPVLAKTTDSEGNVILTCTDKKCGYKNR